MQKETLNVTSGSEDWRGYILSNCACFPFSIDGVTVASAEGFIQGIKFPLNDGRRAMAFSLWGRKAKEIGAAAQRTYVWWNGQILVYNSEEHHRLIERAIREKFERNWGARIALIETGQAELIHDVGSESPNTSLPAHVFCKILTDLRDDFARRM